MDLAATSGQAKALKRGDTVELFIDGLTHDGRGIARHNGKVVFVADALPQETVSATVVRRRRKRDEARAAEIISPSPQRVSPACAWFGSCGGCSLQHLDASAQLAVKQEWLLESLRRIGEIEPAEVLEPLAGPVWGYRRKARLGVKYVDGKQRVLAGFRERYKPYVTDMQGCEVLDRRLAVLIEPIQQLVAGMSIRRRLPQVEMAAGDDRVVLVMRVLDPPSDEDMQLLHEFEKDYAIDLCLQPGNLDSIVTLQGERPPPMHFRLASHDVEIEFQAVDFIQINAAINAAMIDRVVDFLAPGPADNVLDLYSGLGNFTLPLARRAGSVTAVEGAAALVARAADNARRNGIDNASFHTADLAADPAGSALLEREYDLVLLDPPRSGAEAVCSVAQRFNARRLAYVSCHPATLARDAGILAASGRYRLQAAGVMDMFPHTAHVESLALFERVA